MIDLNSTTMFADRVNYLIDEAMQRRKETPRDYLGASVVGHDCERHVQYHLLAARGDIERAVPEPRLMRIFDRGNVYEKKCQALLSQAGFIFKSPKVTWPDFEIVQAGFSDFDGEFKGHTDGEIDDGPERLPYTIGWEHKCLGSKYFNKLIKDKLKKYSSTYYGQTQIYMYYLKHPACLFSATCADTMEIYHELITADEDYANHLRGRVYRVIMASDAGELVPRFTQDASHFICKRCEFKDNCWR